MPDYRRRFDDLYKRWFATHCARIERGESIFKEALKKKDPPDVDRATLEQIEKAVAELAQPARDTAALTLDDRAKATCDEIILELERGLKS